MTYNVFGGTLNLAIYLSVFAQRPCAISSDIVTPISCENVTLIIIMKMMMMMMTV